MTQANKKYIGSRVGPSSETQGQSVGSGEKAGRKFSSTGERAPGYQLSTNNFQKFKQMSAPDWARNALCPILLGLSIRQFEKEF